MLSLCGLESPELVSCRTCHCPSCLQHHHFGVVFIVFRTRSMLMSDAARKCTMSASTPTLNIPMPDVLRLPGVTLFRLVFKNRHLWFMLHLIQSDGGRCHPLPSQWWHFNHSTSARSTVFQWTHKFVVSPPKSVKLCFMVGELCTPFSLRTRTTVFRPCRRCFQDLSNRTIFWHDAATIAIPSTVFP